MTDPSPAPPDTPKDKDASPVRELSRKERALAGVPGILAAAAADPSVLAPSTNEAGRALLLAGATRQGWTSC